MTSFCLYRERDDIVLSIHREMTLFYLYRERDDIVLSVQRER